jgi:phenylpropionate dioxygenase-like ring-hydroxylating dioxygenase large terminal subunit
MRGADGEIRAFYNVCQHRAHELVQDAGNLRSIVCPYHAWSYELDGRLKRARNSDKVEGFDKNAICLSRVRVENFCGFLFVNLDDEAPTMADLFPEVKAGLREYLPQLDRLEPVEWVSVEERCNWKVTVENYSECYHCGVAHPSFTKGVIDPKSYDIRPQGQCLRHTTTAVDAKAMSYEIDADESAHAGDYSSWFLWPTFSFQVYPGGLLNTYHWRPRAVDRTDVVRGWYAPDGERDETVLKMAEQDRATTLAEDVRLVESVQRGLMSRGYRAGPLILDPKFGVDSEHSVRALKDWLLEALAD